MRTTDNLYCEGRIILTKSEMFGIVQNQLAIDLNCNVEKDSFIFAEARDNPGRRPFIHGENYIEMSTMGKSIIVSATPKLLKYVKKQLVEKTVVK